MTTISPPAPEIVASVDVRFDGRDAELHRIDMADLAESLQGLSRIIGVCGNFVATERYALHRDALAVRVVVEEPAAKCYSFHAVLQYVDQSQLLAGLGSGLLVALVSYVFNRASGKKEEMKHLRAIAEEAIRAAGSRDDRMVDRMMSTIDKMADALRPAVKQAVAPLGHSASTLTISDGITTSVVGEAEASVIRSDKIDEVGVEDDYVVWITELDMETGACRLALDGAPDKRVRGIITDPVVNLPNNAYVAAMASRASLRVRAKPTLRGGELEKLFVSDFQT